MSKKGSYKKEAAPEATLDKVTGQQADSKSVPGDAIPNSGQSENALNASKVQEIDTPKTVVNTKKVAELVSGGAVPHTGVATPVLRAAGRINYSGSADNIGGDKSATAEGSAIVKSGDRPGRQADTALQHIDDVPAETFTVPISTIPQITESSGVGYNGKYRNAHAVSQKGSGGSPADSDFFRTLDEAQFDILYEGMGQVNGVSQADKTVNYATWDDVNNQWLTNKTTVLGAYVPRRLKVVFDANKQLESIGFDVDNISTPDLDEMTYRASGDALLREQNLYELDRLQMIDKAGNETKENWSYMGKVTRNARGVATVIGEVEKSIGDMMFLAGSKLSTALAYQNNKAAKDGLRKVAPMYEMMEGNVEGTTHRFKDAGFDDDPNYAVENLFYHRQNGADVYNVNMAHGSAAMYIAMMDSVAKYNTKGKALSLGQSFKTAISTFRQNCGNFRAHKSFIDEFNRQEVFGKLDSDSTGLSPYFISDGANIKHAINIFSGDLAGADIDHPFVRFHYEDERNPYDVPVWNYFLEGLKTFITKYAGKICAQIKAYKNSTDAAAYGNRYSASDDDKYIWEIPVTSTTTCLSMWDILLCAAAKDIALARRYAYDAVIDYESKNEYPYHGTVKLSDVTIGGSSNVGFSEITEPLKAQPIPLNVGVRLMMPEVFWVKGYARDDSIDGTGGVTTNNGTLGSVVLPWYFNQNAFAIKQANSNKNWIWDINPDRMDSMTFFDFRGGTSFENAERIFSMEPEQLKLCLDRMVVPPGMNKQINNLNANFYPTALKYAAHEDGIPVLLAYIASKSASDTDHRITIKDVLSVPRELGLSSIAPSGYVTPNYDGTDANYRDIDSAYFVVSGPSFRIRCWSSTALPDVGNELFDQHRSGNYAVNLKAHYYAIYAQPQLAATDIGLVLTANVGSGLALMTERYNPEVQVRANTAYQFESGTYGGTEVPTAVAAAGSSHTDADDALASSKVVAISKYFYTRLNYLPFVINPFDVNTKLFTGSESATPDKTIVGCNNFDIYDFLHLFNLCGFRCGEYSALAVARDRARIELGIGYVEDPYIQRRA